METIPDHDALALIPVGLPSDDLKPAVEMIASWSDSFSQRALLIGVSGCHAILLLGSDSERMSSRIGSLGTVMPTAPAANQRVAMISVLLRPRRSHKEAPRVGPATQPRMALLVANPSSPSARWN